MGQGRRKLCEPHLGLLDGDCTVVRHPGAQCLAADVLEDDLEEGLVAFGGLFKHDVVDRWDVRVGQPSKSFCLLKKAFLLTAFERPNRIQNLDRDVTLKPLVTGAYDSSEAASL